MKNSLIFGVIFSVLALSAAPSRADEVYTFIIKKQEEKAKNRWSLSDWLATRDKMRLMDLWLALHSPSPYEFFIDGGYRFPSDSSASGSSWELGGGAYASIFGLEIDHRFSPRSETFGLFGLRVFGFHVQDTNITLLGGIRSSSEPVSSRNGVLGARMTFYLTKFFGVEGSFRHLFGPTSSDADVTPVSNRYSGTAFIDFRYLRVYGEYFDSSVDSDPAGFGLGFRFFF